MDWVEQARLQQMERLIPGIWDAGSILYIGACEKRFHFRDRLESYFSVPVDVLEVERSACEYLRSMAWINRVIEMDVTDTAGVSRLGPYDLVLWSHGPETVPQDRVIPTLRVLADRVCRGLMVVLCPWGRYLNDDGEPIPGGNISAVYPDDLLREGYAVATLGRKDRAGSNLLAWRWV